MKTFISFVIGALTRISEACAQGGKALRAVVWSGALSMVVVAQYFWGLIGKFLAIPRIIGDWLYSCVVGEMFLGSGVYDYLSDNGVGDYFDVAVLGQNIFYCFDFSSLIGWICIVLAFGLCIGIFRAVKQFIPTVSN